MVSTLAKIQSMAQEFIGPIPTLVVGSGLSCAAGLPSMAALQQHLSWAITPNGEDAEIWARILADMNELGLENALTRVGALPASLSSEIVCQTWDLISRADWEVFARLLAGEAELPLASLLSFLLATTKMKVEVVTTNYDRLVEYAAERAGFLSCTGFVPGYYRSRATANPMKTYIDGRVYPSVNVWKVHGSLDWFGDQDQTPVSGPIHHSNLPDTLTPLMVTPGIEKHMRTHVEPFRSIMAEADRAMMEASAFMCIGFGFRDSHIEPKIIERLKKNEVPIIVLAMALTDETKAFLQKHSKHYLALESEGTGSRCFYFGGPDNGEVLDADYWSVSGFMELIS